MSAFIVRKIAPVADTVSGSFAGTFIADANNQAHAVQQYGQLAGKSVAPGDKFCISAIESLAYIGVTATLAYPSVDGPATPANGE
jgi:hypothetical protein